MRRALLVLLLVTAVGCHDFEAEYVACVDAGRCERTDAGQADAGTDGGGGDAGSDGGEIIGPTLGVCIEGLCWESPRPTGHDLRDVVALSANEAWFVGTNTVVVHVVGGRVDAFSLGTGDFTSVSSDGTRVLAVQDTSLWDLGARTEHPTGSQERLSVVHHVGDGGFVTGNTGGGAISLVGDDYGLTDVQRVTGDVTSISGEVGALVCAVNGSPGKVLIHRDAGTLSSGWATAPNSPAGNYGPVALDALGQVWLGIGPDLHVLDQAQQWTGPFPGGAGTFAVNDLERVGNEMTFVTQNGEVRRCTAPNQCVRVAIDSMGLSATSTAEGAQYVAGDHGSMLRLARDGGVTRFNSFQNGRVTGLALHGDGSGWAVLTLASGGALWARDAGVWSSFSLVTREPSALAEIGGTLHVAEQAGLQQLWDGQLHDTPMMARDGTALTERPDIFSVSPDGLAVGRSGVMFRFDAAAGPHGAWRALHPSTGTADCKWAAHFDAGVCELFDVLALPDGRAVAVGHLGDNSGVMVTLSGDAGVTVTRSPDVLSALTTLPDGGVFVCGWGSQLLLGDPVAPERQPLAGFTDACARVQRFGAQTMIAATSSGFVEVRWEPFSQAWVLSSERHLPSLRAVTRLGDTVFVGGDLATIVSFKPDAG